MIPTETIEQIRQTVDIVQVIGGYVRLKKRGRNYEGLCPFHTEKTASFKVSTDKQIYHCFGCGKGGNAFTFLMEHESMTFVEAVRFLAAKANIPIRETVSDIKREELERLNYAQVVAIEYFENQLKHPDYCGPLESYLYDRRGLKPETVQQFQLGFSGDSWDGLLRFAKSKDLKAGDMVKAGLATFSQTKKNYYDRFRYRLMIPIFNLSFKPIAFGGRTLKKGETAKYINSPETPLYHKSNVLYGLNFARDAIREQKAVIVVEGYFDLISLWQAGVRNVVASSGTAFTSQQARLLARFAEQVHLFFDADSAGQNAALRSVDSLYDAGLDVKIMVPPDGEDPDSLALKFGRDRIDELAHDAVSFIPYRMRQVDLSNVGLIAKEKLVKEMRELAGKIGDPTRRALFIQEASDTIGVDSQLIRTTTNIIKKDGVPSPIQPHRVEEEFLSVLLNNPGSIDQVLEQISAEDFDSKQLSRLYMAMSQQYHNSGRVSARELVETFGDDSQMVSTLTAVAAHEWDTEQVDVEIKHRMTDFIKRKQQRIRERLAKQLKEAEASGDDIKAARIVEEMKMHGL